MLKVFEQPKKYRTRHGRDVLIFARGLGCTRALGERFFGVVESGDTWFEASWTIGGKFNGHEIGDKDLDLVEQVR